MLIVKNLTKSFGNIKAVNGINFCIDKNGVTALVGPNGAGKTTLLRMISGFYMPDTGEIKINNFNLIEERLSALNSFAYVPENGALYQEMTVIEYIKYMADIHNLDENSFVDNLASLVSELRLQDVLSQKCYNLSKGFKRRVALAGALIHRPDTLILDEPTEGLDPNQKFLVRDFLKGYGKRHTVLISTHIMEEVEAFASRVLLMHHGKLVCDTTPDGLKSLTPANDIETAFRSMTFDK
ncbi:MAG: ABC transporter ATP-binding protein [Alphaproteobacteria bacterium]|nr:ABC transporter ATP-binding protein [Alphaproteobacteria bacterium]